MPTPADEPEPETVSALLAAMRAWRAAHPQATFAEIEGEATRQVAAPRSELIAAALTTTAAEAAPACPACGQAMVRNGTRRRTIVTSNRGRVAVHGPRYRCPACEAELSPPR